MGKEQPTIVGVNAIAAVAKLGNQATARQVHELLKHRTVGIRTVGNMSLMMKRLETRGWLVSKLPEVKVHGRPGKLYSVTPEGRRLLREYRKTAESLSKTAEPLSDEPATGAAA